MCDCPLYPTHFSLIFPVLKDFIGRAGLVPYNIAKQKGELKYILLTESLATGKLMLRFVLRTENKLPLIRRELPKLLEKLPHLEVVSINLQPQHAAILEGEQEIFLSMVFRSLFAHKVSFKLILKWRRDYMLQPSNG